MVEKQSYDHGTFSWVDLITSDQSAAKQFYQELFNWDVEDQDAGNGAFYSMFSKDGKLVAALAEMNDDMKSQCLPSQWNSYINVDSADEIAVKAADLGGTVTMEPFDVFTAGRMTFISDPQQATFAIWQPKEQIGAVLVNEPNTFCWNELASNDIKQSTDFYTSLFGWTIEEMETPNGPYQVIKNGEDFNGGMMQMNEEYGQVPPHWSVYFSVENVGRIAVVSDPQGAGFMIMKLANPE